MRECPLAVQHGTLKRLDEAYEGIFRRVRAGAAAGIPVVPETPVGSTDISGQSLFEVTLRTIVLAEPCAKEGAKLEPSIRVIWRHLGHP